MKWKQHYDIPFPLWHLSEQCHDGELFLPRPIDKDRVMEGENWRAKRICVSKTIDGAISSLVDCMTMPYGVKLYVHKIANFDDLFKHDKVYKPTTKQVPDCEATDEYWLKGAAKLECIGRIEIGYPKDCDLHYMLNGVDNVIDRFDWKWLEKK